MDKETKKRYNEYVETVTPTHNLFPLKSVHSL